ncbi:hypothetical protein M758_3G062000 [Ceratodon purpureus]|nr:hypothetical protein M758_3G062000 [Ceratodon purpureus]
MFAPNSFQFHRPGCMEKMAQKMTSLQCNQELCQYLYDLLQRCFRYSYLMLHPSGFYAPKLRTVDFPQMLWLLLRLAEEVEGFVTHSSDSDVWIQHAIFFPKVSEEVSLVASELALYMKIATYFISLHEGQRDTSILQIMIEHELSSERGVQIAEDVRPRASRDRERLLAKLNVLLRSEGKWGRQMTAFPYRSERQLVTFLLGRLAPAPTISILGSELPVVWSSSSFWEVNYGSLKQLERLGTGGAGIVHKAEWLETLVAEKTFFGSDNPSFKNEVSILAGLSHPNIVPMFCYAMNDRCCSIVMQLMDGDLFPFDAIKTAAR